jgi:predicted glycosyltransferase
MKIVFCVQTPGHVHLFRNIIHNLQKSKHEVKILARDNDQIIDLLSEYGFLYDIYARQSSSKKKFMRGFQLFTYVFNEYRLAKKFKPDLIVGTGPDEPLFSTLLKRPCLLFNDTEPVPLQHLLNKTFADVIITPTCFNKDLGKKQVRVAGYKELAYLHPNYFSPDPMIYRELGVGKDEKYIMLRFNSFNAFHDIGKHGFTPAKKSEMVKTLEQYAKIFISAEGTLPAELESYRLPIKPHRIHHALYYAQVFVSDTGTMNTESAVLGTPAITCLSNANQFGNFMELEHKYDLLYTFFRPDRAIEKAIELIKQPDLKEQWAKKRQKLLNDKIDVTRFMVDFIENYPESYKNYKASHRSNSFDRELFTK